MQNWWPKLWIFQLHLQSLLIFNLLQKLMWLIWLEQFLEVNPEIWCPMAYDRESFMNLHYIGCYLEIPLTLHFYNKSFEKNNKK